MKRIFTLLALVVSVLSGFSQAGSVYRFVGNNNATPANWTANTTVTSGTYVVAGSNVYLADQTGNTGTTAPSGTGVNQLSNSANPKARFDYVSALADYLAGTFTNGAGYPSIEIRDNGTGAFGFRNPNYWRLVTAGVVGGAPVSPASGATLEFFGKSISIENNVPVDLSAYVFKILIRSEYNASIPTTNMALGFIYVDNNDELILGAGSTITLGWGVTTGTQRWTPGYLMLFKTTGTSVGVITIGANTVASALGGGNNQAAFLNAFGYSVSSNVASPNLTTSTQGPTSSHIRLIASAPTANLSSQAAALPASATTPYFARFPFFYNAGAVSPSVIAPLPLQLGAFSAQKGAGKVTLSWKTVLEVNTSHFEVEQSSNASSWKKIATVAAAGNSNSAQNYSADDNATYSSKVYYRLKMVDADGKFEYSPVAVVTFESKGKMFAYPNPASSFTMISSDKAITENVTVSIFNTTGVLVQQQVISKPGNNFRVGLENLKQGSYLLKINSGNELIEVIKIQKN